MLLLRRGLEAQGDVGGGHGTPPEFRAWPGLRAAEAGGNVYGHHGRHGPRTHDRYPCCREAGVQAGAGLPPRRSLPHAPLIPPLFSCSDPTTPQHSAQPPPPPKPPLCPQPRFTLMLSQRCSWFCSWFRERPLLHRGKQPGAVCFLFSSHPYLQTHSTGSPFLSLRAISGKSHNYWGHFSL